MRGTQWLRMSRLLRFRIIPAHAGNTSEAGKRGAARRDHPRTCGEHLKNMIFGLRRAGSSPHMRGTRVSCDTCAGAIGIIPAHAGNTHPSSVSLTGNRDHPRTCGEHRIRCCIFPFSSGSSPHMRGTPQAEGQLALQRGIIPAHAGNTRNPPRHCHVH